MGQQRRPEHALSLVAFSLFLGQGAGVALLGTIVDSGGYGATFAVAGLATWTLALWLAWAVRRQARRLASGVRRQASGY